MTRENNLRALFWLFMAPATNSHISMANIKSKRYRALPIPVAGEASLLQKKYCLQK
jgi:hypothetical protein